MTNHAADPFVQLTPLGALEKDHDHLVSPLSSKITPVGVSKEKDDRITKLLAEIKKLQCVCVESKFLSSCALNVAHVDEVLSCGVSKKVISVFASNINNSSSTFREKVAYLPCSVLASDGVCESLNDDEGFELNAAVEEHIEEDLKEWLMKNHSDQGEAELITRFQEVWDKDRIIATRLIGVNLMKDWILHAKKHSHEVDLDAKMMEDSVHTKDTIEQLMHTNADNIKTIMSKIYKLRSKLLNLHTVQLLYEETPHTIDAFKNLVVNMEVEMEASKAEHLALEKTKVAYEELPATYEPLLKKYRSVKSNIAQQEMLLHELIGNKW